MVTDIAPAGTTVKEREFDAPPPGGGLVIVTGKLPAVISALAGKMAFNCVPLTNVEGTPESANDIVDAGRNPVPVMESVVGPEPATTETGERDVIDGVGLIPDGSTVNGREFEVAPELSGLVTLIGNDPAVAKYAEGTEAVRSCVSRKVVETGFPLKFTTAPGTKLDPLSATCKAGAPATAWLGTREVSIGAAAAGKNAPGIAVLVNKTLSKRFPSSKSARLTRPKMVALSPTGPSIPAVSVHQGFCNLSAVSWT
jgi:hypothetical protein